MAPPADPIYKDSRAGGMYAGGNPLVKALAPGHHGQDGAQALFAGLRLLRGLQAVGDGVGVRLVQGLEEGERAALRGCGLTACRSGSASGGGAGCSIRSPCRSGRTTKVSPTAPKIIKSAEATNSAVRNESFISALYFLFACQAANTSRSRSGVIPARILICLSGVCFLNQSSVALVVSDNGRKVSPLLIALLIFIVE